MRKNAILKHAKNLNLPDLGLAYLKRALDANKPSRSPTGKFLTTHDTLASRKTQFTANSESRSAELPFLLRCEFDDEIIWFADQPEPIKIHYLDGKGRRRGHLVTLDYLVITKQTVLLIECKTVAELEKLVTKMPSKWEYIDGTYYSEPVQTAVESFGFQYLISTDQDYSATYTRNCQFLLNFIDQLGAKPDESHRAVANTIQTVGARLSLKDLNEVYPLLSIVQAIFHRVVFIDFDNQLLTAPEQTWVYHDATYLKALKEIVVSKSLVAVDSLHVIAEVTEVYWKLDKWEVISVSATPSRELLLRRNGRLVTLTQKDLSSLFKNQELYVSIQNTDHELAADSLLCKYRAVDIEEALKRQRILSSDTASSAPVSLRTQARWKANQRSNQDSFIALIPKTQRKGNRTPRIPDKVESLLEEHIQNLYRPSPPSVYSEYVAFCAACQKVQLRPCSLTSFYHRYNKISKYQRTLKQKGFKAAYALGPQPRKTDIKKDIPVDGDYIFEIVHIDHSPVEITLKSKLTGKPIRETLNLSAMIDSHSRRILAVYISFEKPSYRSTMMLLRECYNRFKRLPIFLACDHGSDFQSSYFDATLADIGFHKRRRPKGASRSGSIIERTFGISETEFVHKLLGNRQLQKLGRGQSSTHDPKKFALWTPDEFEALFKDYAYLSHPNINRRGISESPMERWERSAKNFDELPGTKVASEHAFYLATLPNIPGKDKRALRQNQVSYRGINYLLSCNVPGYDGKNINVPAKYDPYDLSHIYVCVNGHWIKMGTNDTLVRECMSKGVKLTHMEVFPRRTRDGRRYRSGSQNSISMTHQIKTKERHQFNLDRVTDVNNRPSTLSDMPSNPLPEFNPKKLQRLNVLRKDKGLS